MLVADRLTGAVAHVSIKQVVARGMHVVGKVATVGTQTPSSGKRDCVRTVSSALPGLNHECVYTPQPQFSLHSFFF